MKNEKFLKILGISLLAVFLLTWLVPGTTLNESNVLERGSVNPAGLLDMFGSFEILFGYFYQSSLLVILVGVLYSVMNKTGAYKVLTDKIIAYAKGQEIIILVLSVIIFTLIPAFTNIYFPLFVLVPFFITILLGVGYNKVTAILATAGSILIGTSSNVTGSVFMQVIGDTDNKFIWIKLGFLVVALIITVLYAVKSSTVKKSSKKQAEEVEEGLIMIPEKKEGKATVKVLPLAILSSLMVIIMFFGLVQWNWKFLAKMHNSVMNYSIGDFKIFANLFGKFNPFGQWGYGEMCTVIIAATIIIGLVYRLKFGEFLKAVVDGGRRFIGIAAVIMLVNLFIIFTFNSGFLATVIDLMVSSGNTALVTIASILGIPFVVDPGYVAQYSMGIISQSIGDKASVNLIALISQLTFGITMLVAPTSIILISVLMYLEENYVKWLKYIWKLAAILVIGLFIAIVIASLI